MAFYVMIWNCLKIFFPLAKTSNLAHIKKRKEQENNLKVSGGGPEHNDVTGGAKHTAPQIAFHSDLFGLNQKPKEHNPKQNDYLIMIFF